MTSPADHDIRQLTSHDIDASIALTAGAGSGKTSVLVARVLALLTAGRDPARLAAITFTEKAAGELEQRVREALERSLRDDPHNATLIRAMRDVGQMQLSTIHSFCQALLVQEALDAAWNPDAEVANAAFSSTAVQTAFDEWQRKFEADHLDDALLLHEFVRPSAVRRFAELLIAHRDLMPRAGEPPDWRALDASLRTVIEGIERAARYCAVPESDKLIANNQTLLTMLHHTLTLPSARERVAFAACVKVKPSKVGGRAADWGGAANKAAFIEATARFPAWLNAVSTALHARVVAHLHQHFLPQVLHRKAHTGEYDFEDLLFEAARLLGDEAARTRLAAQFDAILIDEVQDTDPVQAEVALLLTRDPSASGRWDEHAPRPGALFAVGDPKQSIYRFRRADVHVWRSLRDTIATQGRQLSLSTNFRSVPGIVDWVNLAFRGLPDYEPQVAHRAKAALDPVIVVETGEYASEEAIAWYISQLTDRGHPNTDHGQLVTDRTTGELRPVRPGDVMVLLPGWGKAAQIHARLTAAGIDATVEGGSTFFQRDEVRLLLAAMRCIEEPADAEATTVVLRGLFGFDHAAMLAFIEADGTWRYTVRAQPQHPISEALDVLRALYYRRDRQSWVRTLEELLDECWAPAVWAGMIDGRTRLANIAKFHALIREAERTSATSGATLAALLALAADKEERELPVVDLDANAVRITTYFSAKGLESPIVILAHANRVVNIYQYGSAAVTDRDTMTVALRTPGLDPPDWLELEAAEKAEHLEEQRRWMYVAATRARDQLVIVRSDREPLLDYDIASALPGREAGAGSHDVGGVTVRVIDAAALPATAAQPFVRLGDVRRMLDEGPSTTHSTLRAREERLRDAVGRARRKCVVWRSVGQLVKKTRRARKYEEGVGAAGGTVVHLVMANLDLARPHESLLAELEPLVDMFAAEQGVNPEIRDKCLRILENMLEHPVVARARVAPERWVEAPFSFKERNTVVSGIIDLCFPTDTSRTKWVVVDWKSNLPPVGTPERDAYEQQLAYYGKALIAAVTPCTEIETVLVGPHPELLADPVTEALELVHEDLVDVLARLLDDGVELPEVGLDVGEPIVAMLELAWPALNFGLALDVTSQELAALRDEGWTVIALNTADPQWVEDAYRRIAHYFDGAAQPATSTRVAVADSSLAGTPFVESVDEAAKIAYARDIPRDEKLRLVMQGWMVVEHASNAAPLDQDS